MRKKIVGIIILTIVFLGLYLAFEFYKQNKEKQRRDTFYENLVDTSSPTVQVLRDSITIGYRNEKKTIHIYVPPNYHQDSTTSYPVIYMMDGESSFNDLENMGPEWQIDEVINKASADGEATAIVIGINQAEDRDAEYTPFINDDNPNAHGDKFAQWVATDLKNWVDANYRTKTGPTSTMIGGISRSGMMAYYILMAHPDVFGKAIIQSPSMWVDHDRLLDMTLTKEQLADKKIFVSVGAKEGGIMVPHAKDVYQKFKAQGMGEDALRFESIPSEGHWHITWRKSFALGYPWLMEE
jgi:predicted alpha/beta superfamily hydrolase